MHNSRAHTILTKLWFGDIVWRPYSYKIEPSYPGATLLYSPMKVKIVSVHYSIYENEKVSASYNTDYDGDYEIVDENEERITTDHGWPPRPEDIWWRRQEDCQAYCDKINAEAQAKKEEKIKMYPKENREARKQYKTLYQSPYGEECS